MLEYKACKESEEGSVLIAKKSAPIEMGASCNY